MLTIAPNTAAMECIARLTLAQDSLLANLAWVATFTKDKIGGRDRTGLRRWIIDYSGTLCVLCGDATDPEGDPRGRDYSHMGHLISAEYIASQMGMRLIKQGTKGGYVPANLACQHRGCNMDAGASVIRPFDLARPDLVPLDYPKPSSLRTYGR